MPEFNAENFPVQITPKQTFEMFAESGCLSSNIITWYQVIDRVQDENGWKLSLYEFDEDAAERVDGTVYEVTHTKIVEAMLAIAADANFSAEFRARVIALLVDPDGWDTQFDENDEDVIMQFATWGEERYS